MNMEDIQANLEKSLKPVISEGGKRLTALINYRKMEARYVCGAEVPANEEICVGYSSKHDGRCAFRTDDGACAKPFFDEESNE